MENKEVIAFKEYLESQKFSSNINNKDINIWCDLIELCCYTNKDKILFREDLERELEKQVDGGIQLEELNEMSSQEEADIADSQIFGNGESENLIYGSDSGEKNDLLNQATTNWFAHLKQRENEYEGFYPFKISDDLSEISSKNFDELTINDRLYFYFLIASNRIGLNRKRQKKLEFDFEPIAFQAFKICLPLNGEAFIIGKGSHTSSGFREKKIEKFRQIALKLNISLRDYLVEDYFSSKDTGEGGFDFVGWYKYNDDFINNHFFAGQATCMKDWFGKYNESSSANFGGIFDYNKIGGYSNFLFIPYQYRVGDNWAMPHNVEGKQFVLFDRVRILKNIKGKEINAELIPNEILEAIS